MSIWSCPEKKIPIIMRHFLDILYKSLIDNSYEVMNEKMDHADEKCKWIVSWGVESLKSSATASKHWITAENLFWVAQTVEFTSTFKILKFEYPLSNQLSNWAGSASTGDEGCSERRNESFSTNERPWLATIDQWQTRKGINRSPLSDLGSDLISHSNSVNHPK